MAKDTPLDRLKAATDGKPPDDVVVEVEDLANEKPGVMVKQVGHHICRVIAGDVVAVCDSIPKEKRTTKVKELRYGAGNNPAGAPIFVMAPDLHELIGEAGMVSSLSGF